MYQRYNKCMSILFIWNVGIFFISAILVLSRMCLLFRLPQTGVMKSHSYGLYDAFKCTQITCDVLKCKPLFVDSISSAVAWKLIVWWIPVDFTLVRHSLRKSIEGGIWLLFKINLFIAISAPMFYATIKQKVLSFNNRVDFWLWMLWSFLCIFGRCIRQLHLINIERRRSKVSNL